MKKVSFNPKIVYIYNNEEEEDDTDGEKPHNKKPDTDLLPIQILADRQRFRDRILRVGEILNPILEKHGQNCK